MTSEAGVESVNDDFGRAVLRVMADGPPSSGDNLLGMEMDFFIRLGDLEEIDSDSVEVKRTGSAECLIRACRAASGVSLGAAADDVRREWLLNLRYNHFEAHRVRTEPTSAALEFVTQIGPGSFYVTGRVEIVPSAS